jgi:predicted nucleic acid-binding protein
MIIVDSGVWIDFFNNKKTKEAEILQKIINNKTEIGINYLIMAEILQGANNEKEYEETKMILDKLKLLEIDYDTIILSSSIFRACKKGNAFINGQTMKTIDCIIASSCIEYGIELLHRDTHFDFISKFSDLKVYCK